MIRRLLLLNGLATLALPIHHATGYGFFAMFQWTDRYQQVTVPNYEQIGSLAFYVIIVIQQLDYFALSAFMFVSGFFAAFAARGSVAKLEWSIVRSRVIGLLVPFTIWTVIFFILFTRRLPNNLDEILDRYYYIPLVIQFYLLAPFFVAQAKRRPKLVLAGAALLELGRFTVRYLQLLDVTFPGQDLVILLTPRWLFPMLFFWFVLGLVIGFHREPALAWLARFKWALLAVLISLTVLTMVEYTAVAHATEREWLGPYFGGYARQAYALTFISCFLAFDNIKIPFSPQLSDLGTKSLGIYLVHNRVMYVVAVLMYELTPAILGHQFLYQLILIFTSLVGSLALMRVVKISLLRPLYRHAFG